MKAPSTAINRFRCQALDADEEESVQATRVPPELNQTVHTVAAVGIGVDVLGTGCQNGSGVVRVLSVRVRRAGFLWEIGQPRIRRTEVRPIFRRRAISDLLMPAR